MAHAPRLWNKLKPKAREMRKDATSAEDTLWQRLRKRQIDGVRFRRQHTLDRYVVDFYAPEFNLVVEVDGPVHRARTEEDRFRDAKLESLGFRTIRFTNDDVMNRVDHIIDTIRRAIRDAESPAKKQTS